MEKQETKRGFGIYEFTDLYGEKCSLQESSLATEGAIWLGVNAAKLTVFEDETKGRYLNVKMPDNFSVNCRMHLNRQQVKELLPILLKFVQKGQI